MKNIITAVWCRRLDCRFCNKRHTDDIHGRFSSCGKEEITIDQNGRCECYETEEEFDPAEIKREVENYKAEIEWDGENL